MEQDFNLHVKLDTSDAVQGLTNIKTAAEQAATSVGKIGESAQSAAQEVSKVGDVADESIPKIQGLGSAFEGVFGTAIKLGSGVKGTFGEIFSKINQAIPTVKKLNNTAITGLKGVSAALASTGIGTIIVAVGILTSHWEGFLKAIGSSKEKFEEFKDKAINSVGNVIAGIVGVGNVIVQYLITPVKTAIQYFSGLGRVIKDIFTGNWKEIGKDIETALGNIKTTISNGFDTKAAFEKGKEAGQKFVQGVKTTLTYKAGEKTGKEFSKGVEDGVKNPLFDKILKELNDKKALDKAVVEFKEKILPGIISQIQQAVNEQGSTLKFTSPEEIFDSSTIEKAATRWLQYTNEIAAIELQESRDHKEHLEERKLVEENYNKDLEKILLDRSKEYKENAEKEAKERAATAADLKKDIVKSKELQQEWLEMEYDHEAAMISIDPYITEYQRNRALAELEQQRLQDRKKYLEDLLSLETEGTDEYESLLLQIGKTIRQIIEVTQELNNIKGVNSRFLPTPEEWENAKGDLEAMAALLAGYWENWEKLGSSISSIIGSVSDMYEENSRAILENAEAKLEAGEITEEEYKKEEERSKQQFERSKQLQVATTVLNTISGAIGAFLQNMAKYEFPLGPIFGAAAAAAATAAGVAEIQKIKNTSFNTSNVGGSSISANVGVTPIDVRDDIQQSPTVLANSQSPTEQQVFILQGDLEDSHRQVQIREGNTTF